ncbi:ATP-binding cassette domain-containing protein [Hydrogenoanaerobacterium sp.]|uniref:ABC transporter ATP-binding protein n=1 Tax=Hydrogenoanaerobacterium sp. TaxID=2953763 RepID=UPI00289FFDDB|nr:ATP-binding cassette domain-containing protein [Hydrogenoanaerobacterium sp.]
MIEVKNLVKHYGNKHAVDGISFSVSRGEILGFLGPNGAGKSTTMNIITGYLSCTSGSVIIDGIDMMLDPIRAKSKIGYLPELPPLYLDMTVGEYLDFMYELKKVKLPRKQHLKEVCDLVKITDVSGRLIKNLSKGYKQRVGLAQALLGNPDLLILDEPTVGLDPAQIIEIRSLIKELGKKHTVILSSHILPEVQAVCERVIVISKGKLVADDSPENLSKAMSSDHRLLVRIEGSSEAVLTVLGSIANLERCELLGEREPNTCDYLVEAVPGTDIRREMFFALAKTELPMLFCRSQELTLEDVFLQLIQDDAAKNTEGGDAK